MISVEKLTVEFGGFTLFDDISFVINPKDRIALVGRNGAGKSTMLKIFAGLQSPTRGNVAVPKGITIGYLPQTMILTDIRTVKEEASLAFENIRQMQTDIDALNHALATRTDYDSPEYHEIIEEVSYKMEVLQMSNAGNFEAEIEKTLFGLGFSRSDFGRKTHEFSGGWRMRIELVKLLLQRPDVLLLDEPTNHLDIESIQWLEKFLATHANAVILVSHDRAFIDAVTNRTIEISLGQIYDYKVSYSKYVALRKERREQQIRAYENQQKQIQDTEDFIERFRYKATKSVQVQSRIKQLEKIDRIEIDLEDNSALRLKFPPAPRAGDIVLDIENLTKEYKAPSSGEFGGTLVFSGVNMQIKRGEKVAFVGKNGEGKTTLVKCIMNQITDYEGKLKIGHNVKIGYFAQNQASLLDESKTVFETIDYVATGDIRTKIRDILGAFMFGGEASDKKVKVLSGGERSRLAMIRLLLEPVNLLILDEPTNHLDMQSKDVLKEAILAFNGTAIVVSHDREFLDGLVTKVYEFGGGKLRENIGGIYDFLAKAPPSPLEGRDVSLVKKKNIGEQQIRNEQTLTSPPSGGLGGALSYEARKEQSKKIRRAERNVEEAEEKIAALESEIKETETKISEGIAGNDIFTLYNRKKHELDQLMYEWEILTEELEKLKN